MNKLIAAALLSLLTITSTFADCRNAYEVMALARAELIKDVKKVGAISGVVVVSAVTLAVMAVEFVIAPGPGWMLIPPTAFGGAEAILALLEVSGGARPNKFNTFYQAIGTITAAKSGALPKQLISDLDDKLNLNSLSKQERAETLQNAVKIIIDGNQNNLFCQRSTKGHYKIYSYKKILKHVIKELN